VREALRQIIARLNSPSSSPAALVMADGVFVPLQAFVQHHVDPALAVRALGEAGMLSCATDQPQSRTCLRELDQEPVLGLVLAPRWVRSADGPVHGAAIGDEGSAP
jgi:conjugal transfer pilus assembly protein TraI